MAKIDFYGKQQVYNWHLQIPTPHLVVDNKKSTTSTTAITDNNLVIKGDNLKALKALLPYYQGKIDLIYIDPPYNTGSQIKEGGFVYNDSCDSTSFNEWINKAFVNKEDLSKHDKWLCMMWPRLQLAKELLSPQGVIFISIGNDEFAQLKILMDEIFGEPNFIEMFIWEKTQHFGRQALNSYNNAEYVFAYAKQLKSNESSLRQMLVEKIKTDLEDAPLYNASNPQNVIRFPIKSVKFNLPDGTYTKTSDDKYKLHNPVTVKNGFNTTELVLEFNSRWSQDTVTKENLKGTIFWVKTENFAIRAIYHADKQSLESPKQVIFTNSNNPFCAISRYGKKVGTSEEGSAELERLGLNFSYPKPVSLIEYLISLYWNADRGGYPTKFTVLDFFAGSGTTAQAISNLNQQGSNIQFILTEQEEYLDTVTISRLKNESFIYCNLSEPVDKEKLLLSTDDKDLPSFEQLAKQACLNALNTPSSTDLQKKHKWLVGNKNNTYVFLIYEPSYKWLSSDKSSLTEDLLNEMLDALPSNYEQVIVYATSRFMSHEDLVRKNVAFLKLPFNI